MEIESYSVKLSSNEVGSLVKVLGGFSDTEFEGKGIVGMERELLRNMYSVLKFLRVEEE